MPEIEKGCDLPRMPIELLEEEVWQKLFMNLLMFPEKTLKNWMQIGKGNKDEVKKLKAKLKDLDKEIQKRNEMKDRLLTMGLEKVYTPEELISKAAELEKAKLAFIEDKKIIQNQLEVFEIQEQNTNAIKSASDDLQAIAEEIAKKQFDMTIKEKKYILDALIPYDTKITIEPLHPSDYHRAKSSVMQKHSIRKWDWRYEGTLNINKVLSILKYYIENGKMPNNIEYGEVSYGEDYLSY